MQTNRGTLNMGYRKEGSLRLPEGPDDTISELMWGNESQPSLLAAASWDSSVRIWDIVSGLGGNLNAKPMVKFTQTAPILSCCFSPDNKNFYAGGCADTVKMYDLASGNPTGTDVAKHDQPICKVRWLNTANVLATASWDGTIKMWDLRTPNPVWSYKVQGKIFCMDIKGPYTIIGDNNLRFYAWDFTRSFDTPVLQIPSPLRSQTRSLALFPTSVSTPGFAIGTIEGRVSVQLFSDCNNNSSRHFQFKCYRYDAPTAKDFQSAYSVNAIDFLYQNPSYIVTGGSDGKIVFWNRETKVRARYFEQLSTSVTDVKCNLTTLLLAYTESYDWHKGDDPNEINKKINNVYVHRLRDADFPTKK